MIREFKKFLIDGNLVDVAVGLLMAIVLTALVKALVADLPTPIIALIAGKPLQRTQLHDQRQPLPLRRLHQQPDHVHLNRRRRVLLRGQAL
jgi:large-conductance mechanosensitive channel